MSMTTRVASTLLLIIAVAVAWGCSSTEQATSTENTAENTTRVAPDNSEITTKVDASGVKTEERVFHDNPRLAKVVVTTNNGTRNVKAYSHQGEERELKQDDSDNVLEATGNKIADAAGFTADKAEDVGDKTKDVAEATKDKTKDIGEKTADTAKGVGEKTADTAKTVGDKSVDTAKTVSDKTVEGAKKVGSGTASGAKKVGKAVKKVIP